MTVGKARVLLTGPGGLLGSHLLPRLAGKYDVTGVSRKAPSLKNAQSSFVSIDLSDSSTLKRFLDDTQFDMVINCAAMADVDLCERERDKALKINVEAARVMAAHARKNDIILIHISTDYLFDGLSGPYSEDAAPNPINFYGRTKLLAEEAIRESGCKYTIVRTNHLYGNLPDGPSKQIKWLLQAADRNEPILAATDLSNNPTWSGNLADAIVELLESDIRGVINLGGSDYLSRYEFALAAADILGLDRGRIRKASKAELNMLAARPSKAGLKIDLMKSVLRTRATGVSEGLKKVHAGWR